MGVGFRMRNVLPLVLVFGRKEECKSHKGAPLLCRGHVLGVLTGLVSGISNQWV